jgi:hypothetical protein
MCWCYLGYFRHVAIVNIFVNLSPTTMTFVIVVVGSAQGLLSMLLHSPIKRETGESAVEEECSVCAEEEERVQL